MSASTQQQPITSVNCVIFGPNRFEAWLVEALEESLGAERVDRVERAEELEERTAEPRLVLYRQEHDFEELTALFKRLRGARTAEPAVCVIDDGDWKAANSALSAGASDYLFVEQFESEHLREALLASRERARVEQRQARVQRELE